MWETLERRDVIRSPQICKSLIINSLKSVVLIIESLGYIWLSISIISKLRLLRGTKIGGFIERQKNCCVFFFPLYLYLFNYFLSRYCWRKFLNPNLQSLLGYLIRISLRVNIVLQQFVKFIVQFYFTLKIWVGLVML